MRPFLGLVILLAIAGCADGKNESSKKYLYDTDRCEDLAEESQEYKDCKEALAKDDARRAYELRRAADSVPSWLPPTSLPQ